MPGQGHKKGGVENDAGYVPRNFLTPLLQVNSYEELNAFSAKLVWLTYIVTYAAKKLQ